MEHSFKRRRLSLKAGRSTNSYHSHSDDMVPEGDEGSDAARSRLNSRSYGSFADHVHHTPRRSTLKDIKLAALHPRNFVATGVASSVQPPAKTVISSVIQVVVDDGEGAQVTELLVPVKTKVISLPGFAPITLGNRPEPTASSSSVPGYQSPSPTRPAASSQAAQTIQASRTPSNAASSSSTNLSLMSISVAESQSQAVLSSPPSTPLPSTPSSSSPTSTGSYFSSSSVSNSLQSSVAAQATGAQLSPGLGSGNSTTTVPTTSFSGTSTFSQATFLTSVNSTLITSTRLSSSRTSGASPTTSSSSTNSLNSISSSSLPSTSASQTQTSVSSTPSSSLSSSSTAAVVAGGGGGFGGASGTGSAPSSTQSSGAGSGGGQTVSTPAVVGGVVGGLAGLAIILILMLFLLRRRKAKARQRTISLPVPQTSQPAIGTGATTERSSVVPFAAAAFMRRMRPGSGQTAATTDTAPSERGFQNMGGRKLESVLSSRGDGYSDPVPASGVPPRNYGGTAAGLGLPTGAGATRGQGPSPGPSDDETLSGSSFYRDSHGFYGGSTEAAAGPSASPSTSPPQGAGGPSGYDQEIAVTRPGPARTPVINEPGFAPFRQPGTGRGTPPPGIGRGTPPPRALTPQLRQQDDVGRSHPSFDGSRGSRFAEDI